MNHPTLQRLQRLALWLEDGLLVLLLIAMVLLASAQILLRNLADTSLAWGDPSLRVLVLWITMLGAMVATREHHHIRIDLLSRFLPPWGKRLAQGTTDLFAGLVCALLAWHSARFVWLEYQDGITLFAGVPAWLCELAMPLGFATMALRFVLRALGGKPPEAG